MLRLVTSSRITRIFGSASIASVMRRENSTRSTASACPAGTAVSSAIFKSAEPARRISCFSNHGAVLTDSLFNEFEQTNSPNSVVWCAGVNSGLPSTIARISYRSTSQPRRAAVNAASGPASPPPITRIFVISPSAAVSSPRRRRHGAPVPSASLPEASSSRASPFRRTVRHSSMNSPPMVR